MKRKIVQTSDGSSTIFIEEWNEHYHSKHGAIQEAYHVFIKNGFYPWTVRNPSQEIHILEIGFGTGLNAFITYLEGEKTGVKVHYEGVEAYPVSGKEVESLNYIDELNAVSRKDVFQKMHDMTWDKAASITPSFTLKKRKQFFDEVDDAQCFDLIYFDAFGARVQPELWEVPIFQKMYNALKKDGILVTYAAKGSVRRAILEVGFEVERLPGPPGKREMLRAVKAK